jgi:G protein-coupled glucose receptor regulating Gpa2/G protein-coupled glucose receptor regulating Gpa2 C-term
MSMPEIALSPTPTAAVDPNALTDTLRHGLIPLSVFALCSALSTFTLLCWITFRLVFKNDYQSFVGYNQYVILIYNLLLADFQQSVSFLFTLYWLRLGKIDSPSAACFAQAWLLNMGDLSSGMFVLAIAAHTWYSVVLGRKVKYSVFTAGILGIWALAFLLTVLGPSTKGPNFFAKTNAWCWINTKYDLYRLWFHYLWVFVVEFGTIIIYAHIFFHLRKRLRSIRSFHPRRGLKRDSSSRLSQAARYMILYPIIYVVLTLPLAAGRMAAMAGRTPPLTYYCIAGSLLTSCGWLDTLLYTLTRRVFIKSENNNSSRGRAGSGSASGSRASQQAQRWHGRKKSVSPPPVPEDPNWPLSTFASVNIDYVGKESDGFKNEAHHTRNPSTGFSKRSPTPNHYRSPTPILDDSPSRIRHLQQTETRVQANSVDHGSRRRGTDSDTQSLIESGIRSETTIEVRSESADEVEKRLNKS